MTNRVLPTSPILLVCFVGLIAGCKPTTDGQVASSERVSSDPTPVNNQQPEQSSPRKLTAEQWFSKKGISAEEARTVDAVIDSIQVMGGPESKPATLARWAERNVQILALDNLGLTEVSPILVFKNVTTLSLSGNKLTQKQIDQVLISLPKLKILTIDSGLNCEVNRKVKCLY